MGWNPISNHLCVLCGKKQLLFLCASVTLCETDPNFSAEVCTAENVICGSVRHYNYPGVLLRRWQVEQPRVEAGPVPAVPKAWQEAQLLVGGA